MTRAKASVAHLGPRLSQYREKRGLSREEVAVSLGKSWATVRAYERGAATPPLDVLLALAELYRVDAGRLIKP